MFWWTHRYMAVNVPNFDQMGSPAYFVLRLIEQAVIFAIPSFIFVSGFFVAVATRRDQRTIEWRIVLTRIKNLLIPFTIWSLLILAAGWMQGQRYSLGETFIVFITGRTAAPYYYVPLLVQLLLIAPVLVPLARNRAGLLLIVTGVIQIFVLLLRYVQILELEIPELKPLMFLNRSWLFTTYVFWFSFGIVAGFHLERVKYVLNRLKNSFPILMVIFFVLGVIEWEYLLRLSGQEWIGPSETLIDQVYAGAVILGFLLFEKFNLPLAAQLADLGSKSYGVYLVHAPVLEYSARLIYHFVPGILANEALFQPVLIVLGLGIPLVMMAAVNRSPARMLYKTVFG